MKKRYVFHLECPLALSEIWKNIHKSEYK